MPTLFRFLVSLLVIGAVFAAIVLYLGNMVEPNTRELTIRLPSARLDPKPVAPPPAPAPPLQAGVEDSSAAGTGTAAP